MSSRRRVLARVDAAWAALKESYTGLSRAGLTEPGVTGDWSVKDVLAHVTTWEAEALQYLPLILAGGRPPRYTVYGGLDAFNARTSEEKRGLLLAEVLRQLDETHRQLRELIGRIPEVQFTRETRARRRIRLETSGHYPEHAAAIRRWRRRRAGGRSASEPRGHEPPPGVPVTRAASQPPPRAR